MTTRGRRSGQHAMKPCLSATIRDATLLSRMLRSIEISRVADVIISATGLIFRTDMDHNNMQAKAFINATLFDTYQVNEDLLDNDDGFGAGDPPDDDNDDDDGEGSAHVRTKIVVLSLRDLLICLDMYGGGSGPSSSAGSLSSTSLPSRNGVSGQGISHDDMNEDDPFVDQGRGANRSNDRSRQSMSNGNETIPKTAVKIVYDGQGSPFTIQLDEGKRSTTCKLITNEPQNFVDVGFSDEDKIVRVVLESKEFAEAIRSIDPTSRSLEVGFFPRFSIPVQRAHARRRGIETTTTAITDHERNGRQRPPNEDDAVVDSSAIAMARSSAIQLGDPNYDIVGMMKLTAEGDTGSAEVQLPFDASKPLSEQLFSTFEADVDTRASYHFKYFSNAYTALSTASKTSIRLQPNGIMSIQCIFPPGQDDHVPVDEGLTRNGFVDMLITPLASDEEELY